MLVLALKGQDPPLDGHPLGEGVGVVQLLLLERPYVAAELGAPPLVLVPEGGGVVPVSLLPNCGRISE